MGGLGAALWMLQFVACLQKHPCQWSVCCGGSSVLSVQACARGSIVLPFLHSVTDDMIVHLLLGLCEGPSGF